MSPQSVAVFTAPLLHCRLKSGIWWKTNQHKVNPVSTVIQLGMRSHQLEILRSQSPTLIQRWMRKLFQRLGATKDMSCFEFETFIWKQSSNAFSLADVNDKWGTKHLCLLEVSILLVFHYSPSIRYLFHCIPI